MATWSRGLQCKIIRCIKTYSYWCLKRYTGSLKGAGLNRVVSLRRVIPCSIIQVLAFGLYGDETLIVDRTRVWNVLRVMSSWLSSSRDSGWTCYTTRLGVARAIGSRRDESIDDFTYPTAPLVRAQRRTVIAWASPVAQPTRNRHSALRGVTDESVNPKSWFRPCVMLAWTGDRHRILACRSIRSDNRLYILYEIPMTSRGPPMSYSFRQARRCSDHSVSSSSSSAQNSSGALDQIRRFAALIESAETTVTYKSAL